MKGQVNDGTGVLEMKRSTPVIAALFGLFHLQKIKKQKRMFYISRRSKKLVPKWSDITQRMDKVLGNFGLQVPSTQNAKEYFSDLLIQMQESDLFGSKQIVYLTRVLGTLDDGLPVELDQLFQIALAFNDGHRLKTMHFESARHNLKTPDLFDFSGNGLYVTKKAIFFADIEQMMLIAEVVSNALEKTMSKKLRDACVNILCIHLRVFLIIKPKPP